MPNNAGDDFTDKCPFCREKYEEGDEVSFLPCTHKVHKDCLDTFMEVRNVDLHEVPCPICRATPDELLALEDEIKDGAVHITDTELEEEEASSNHDWRALGGLISS